jgi:DNA-binding response OmpR family regulator
MKSLLHVEDSESMQKAVALMLSEKNISLESVSNGKLALDLTALKQFDGILLDLDMPIIDGLEFLSQFNPTKKGTTVLVCSARHDVNSIYKAIELGASDYIMKPFTDDILFSKLKQLNLL